MLATLANKTASIGMNLEDVSTSLRLGKDGEREFVIDAMVSSPKLAHAENIEDCVNDISTLEKELCLKHFDVRVTTK
jgi:hypothetical protein